MTTTNIETIVSFFAPLGVDPFSPKLRRLLASPLWHFPQETFREWERHLEALRNPASLMAEGTTLEAIQNRSRAIRQILEKLHPHLAARKDHFGLVIGALSISALQHVEPSDIRSAYQGEYGRLADAVAYHLKEHMEEVDSTPSWSAGPLAFFHLVQAVEKWHPEVINAAPGPELPVCRSWIKAIETCGAQPILGAGNNNSRVFDFLLARYQERCREPGHIEIFARTPAGWRFLLPENMREHPPEVVLSMIGLSGSAKSTLGCHFYNYYLHNAADFQGVIIEPAAVPEDMLENGINPSLLNQILYAGQLQHTRQRVLLCDSKGAFVLNEVDSLPKGPRQGANGPRSAEAESETYSVREMVQSSDLLIVALAPEDLESPNFPRLQMRLISKLRLLTQSNSRAMVAFVFSKADDYGLSFPGTGVFPPSQERGGFGHLVAGAARVQKVTANIFEGYWENYMEKASLSIGDAQSKALIGRLLRKIGPLWKTLVEDLSWRGRIGAYLVAAQPEDPGYRQKSGEVFWDRTGIVPVFNDFFQHYQPQPKIVSVGKLLKQLGRNGKQPGALAMHNA